MIHVKSSWGMRYLMDSGDSPMFSKLTKSRKQTLEIFYILHGNLICTKLV